MENIRIGRKDATDEEVMRAAKLAHCEEFVERMHFPVPMIHTQTMMEKDCFLQEVLMGIHIRQFYCPGIKLQTE